MNGAESLLRTAVAAGVELCFANPGTTEMPLVAMFDRVPGIRAVLGLFEGVCTGAADGYARMAEKPALTLLHLGPGFANGIANLHNARRARSAIVNLIGDHASWHLAADAPLTSDIESLARPVSHWVRRNRHAAELAADMADAVAAAGTTPGRVATLIVPHDAQYDAAHGPVAPRPLPTPTVDATAVEHAAAVLRGGAPAALVLGGAALLPRGLRAAARVAAATGAHLLVEQFPARLERGAGLPGLERLPYFPEQVLDVLAPFSTLVLAGGREPVAFFGYAGMPSRLVRAQQTVVPLAVPDEHRPPGTEAGAVLMLEALADTLGAAPDGGLLARVERPQAPTGGLDPVTVAAALAAVQPERAIIVEEAATTSVAYYAGSAGAPPHTLLTLTGGAIGQGPPCATGAAFACPDRPVINFQADGSAMFTLQALWTQAREGLNVTTLVCANRAYRILQFELMRAGIAEPGPQAMAMTDLSRPPIDWVLLGRGFGVPSVRVESADALVSALRRAIEEPGPHLIEMVL